MGLRGEFDWQHLGAGRYLLAVMIVGLIHLISWGQDNLTPAAAPPAQPILWSLKITCPAVLPEFGAAASLQNFNQFSMATLTAARMVGAGHGGLGFVLSGKDYDPPDWRDVPKNPLISRSILMLNTATEMATTDSPLREAERRAKELFTAQFGGPPRWVVAAPGRVNIIGEHIDYNDGFVLPMAIERYVIIAAAPARDRSATSSHILSANLHQEAELELAGQIEPGSVTWASYAQGVVAGFAARGMRVEPFDAVIYSTVPLGGGLSSSAALEVATATLLEAIRGETLDPIEKALLCQQAEHKFAGVPCGIMDQFSSVLCQTDHLMLLDCRSHAVTMVPFTDPHVTVLIVNSNVRHELTGGEYAKRRAECEEAARVLGVPSLREMSLQHLIPGATDLAPVPLRRARHGAARAIANGEWELVGRQMYASHNSLRDDYEVSCPELDLLVRLASQQPGVIGSRMTGGGFGGCTVSLVWTEQVPTVLQALREQYQMQTHIEPSLFVTRPAQGAQVLNASAS
jgi:galactokinase